MIRRDFALAVKGIIIKENKALLLRRSKREVERSSMISKETWDLPGGGVRFFETAEKGLLREISEETKLKVNILKPLNLYDIVRPTIHMAIFTYVCEFEQGEVILSSEHEKYYWIEKHKIDDYDVPKWLKRDFLNAFEEYEFIKLKKENK